MPTVPGKGQQDYRVFVGARVFDPKDEAAAARRRAGAAKRRRAATGRQARAIGGEPLLVQFTSPLSAPDIERLRRDYDLTLEDYVPNLAFVELVAPQVIDALRNDFLVRTTMAIDPAMKLAPQIGTAPAPGTDRFFNAALVRGADPAAVAADITALGAREVHTQDHGPDAGFAIVRFAVDDVALTSQVADLEEVLWIEPLGAKVADNTDAAAAIQTGTSDGAPIWDRGLHGEGHVIAVMDDGPPDINHCFFADTPNNPGPNHRKIVTVPRNATPPPPPPAPALTAHATAMAGIVAGDDRNLPGSNRRRGGAWAARLVCSNFNDLDPPASSGVFTELGADAAAGAFVHSNSWHENTNFALLPVQGIPPVYGLIDWAIDDYTWQNEDHLVLGAAGNRGEELGPPGTAKNAICVGAALARPNQMSFGNGNPGPTADGRRKPDLMAVGCGIETAAVSTPCGTGPARCSTSRATANASAAAVLVRQYFTEGWYPSGEKEAKNAFNPTAALLKAVLLNSTVDMTGAGVAGYPSNAEGWGLIRLDRTLMFRGQQRRMKVWDRRHVDPAAPTPGANIIAHEFEVADNTEQLKVTLVWSDPPPGLLALLAPPVNDLDLKVTAPDRTDYLGNDFTNGVSTPNGTTADAVNNVEMVVVNNPPAGKWQLEVHGVVNVVNVGNPGQGYALVATANLKKRCFVATAVYGDPDHPDVQLIRDWRDGELERGGARGAAMGAFAAAYERVGPPLARAVERRPRLARLLRRRVFEPAVARRRSGR